MTKAYKDFTHFINDPDNPQRAKVFRMYKCSKCLKDHRTTVPEPTFMSWITAALNLTQVMRKDVPPAGCDEK